MAYSQHTWTTGEPITQERMNHIERGIGAIDTTASQAESKATTAQQNVSSLSTQVEAVSGTASRALSTAERAEQSTAAGTNAWTQIKGVITIDPNTNTVSKSLSQVINGITDALASTDSIAKQARDDISSAIQTSNFGDATVSTFKGKIENIIAQVDTNKNQIGSVVNEISTARSRSGHEPFLNLQARMNSEYTEFSDFKTSIEDAYKSAAYGQDYTTLDARLEADENRIIDLNNSALKPEMIVNDFSSNDATKVLSAAAGRTLRNLIGGTYDAENTVTKAINTALSDAKTYADDNKVAKTDVYNDLDYTADDKHVLDARQGKALNDRLVPVETALEDALASTILDHEYESLDERLEAIESDKKDVKDEVIAARTSSVVRTPGENDGDPDTDTTYANLDARLEAIESHAAAVRTDVNTIAGELAMVDNESIVNTNTRVDTLESDLRTMAAELNMLDGTAIKDTNTRIDSIEGEIDAAHRTDEDTLSARFSAIESSVSDLNSTITNAETGLAKTKEIADEALDKANKAAVATEVTSALAGKASTESVSDLSDRVTTLEKTPKSATAVIDNVTYDNDGNPTDIGTTPSPDVDYLLKKGDKYYYWKYLNDKWQLISGADGGGSGNTSGFVYTASQYNNLKTNHTEQLIENADYYVLQSDIQYEGENSRSVQAYHHYRYVKNNEDVLQEIEIGEPISRAKTYTIERDDDIATGKAYLNLYEFDYGIDNSAISDNPSIYLRAHIELPKGGGESSASSLKLIRLNDETRQVRVGKKIYLYAYFSAIADDQTENGKYVLKYNGITIDSGDLVSGKATDDPNNWIVIEDPKFTEGQNPTPIIASPDSTKLYIIQQHTDEGDVYTQWTYTDDTWSSTEGYPNGFIAFDVTNRCKTGDNTLTLTATAVDRNRSRSWNVNIVDLRLESNAPDTLLINVNDPYSFSYIPYGAIQKSLKITIDNNEPIIKGLGTSSGLENFYELTGLTHGAHIIRMQLTAIINGKSEDSDEIIRQYIWYNPEDSSSDVILASRYNNQTETIEQYSNIEIPYQVYKKDASSIFVYYYLDDAETPFSSVKLTETNSGILSYIAITDGNHKLTIKVDNQEINVNLVVTRATKQISPVTGAIIDFDPAIYSNDAVERLPQWKVGQNTYKFTDSSNFNWSNNPNGGGYKEDEDGKCLVIKAGSYIDLNYNLFRTESEPTRANVFKRGAEMKIIFKVKSVRNTKAVWLTNTGDYQNKKVGLTLKAHYGELRTDKAVGNEEALDSITADEDDNPDTVTIKGITYNYWKPDTSYTVGAIVVIRDVIYKCIDAENTSFSIDLQNKEVDLDDDDPKDYLKKWLKLGQLNTEVISTDSYLYFPYSENDKIELDININSSDSANQFIMSYEDGVPSKAYAYTASDHLQHSNNIHIGSPDCDVYIYKLRIYDRALSTANILQNFIADGKTVEEKVKRHDRNCIYWNSNEKKYYIQKTGEAKLDPIKLAELMPDVKILMLDVPHFTTGKKDFIRDTTLRCIQADGGKVYPSRGDADNWFFDNGFHAGQGTTSDNYGQSARNVDFLFEVDGTHWPTKSKNMAGFTNPPDYQSRVWIGENASKYIVTDEDPAGHWVPTSKYDENTQNWIIDDEVVSAEEEINPTTPSICDDWMGNNCKISLTDTSIPNNYFNLKENVASSENVNNALFQKRYNDFLPYTSPAKQRDARIKNGMEFVPAVLFVRESGPLADHTEFADTDWHFYGLGNLGDSKKTDYTRAYDPTDMYEFTCENSDNNTNNGQFQSGVFMYNNIRAIETSYAAWNENTKYGENAIVIREGKIYQYTGEEMSQAHAWDSFEWNDITPIGNETHYYAPRTNPDTMSYIYPITSEEWNITLNNNYVNRKHYTLVNEAFDGDHSFEFRYACCGDFRDGDRINDTHGGTGAYKIDKKGKQVEITVDDVQEELNHNVICALYEWLVTSTEDQYKNEASQWMIKPAMEFFYAFTHYYTMMDNRAKNTFWHFAKTGEHRKVTRPVKELLHVYEESNNAVKNVETGVYTGTFTKTTLTTLPETYYVQGYLPVTDKHFKDGVTYYKLDINTNTYTATTSVNYTDMDGAPLTMTIKPNYEIPETAEALYTLGFIQTEESEFLSDVQYYTYTNNAYTPVTVTVGDHIKYLYTQYAFDLWVYDTDTALGIDNNGAQVFPYGKEDDDYRVKNEPSSGWAFNGAGSIFWRRLKTTFIDEIAEIMNTVDDNCFNSENLINEFDNFQNCFPEEIWRLDIERKYIRTFTGVTNELPYDNAVSEGKQNARFLMSMMQGRKKYQRRQWIRNQGIYFNSKYLLKDIKNNSNTTEFNIITPTGDINDLAVRPTYNLQLTPYQDMYLNVTIGNGGPTPSIRAEAGKTYPIDLLPYSAGTFAETRLYIYGFKSIAGLGNLAPMYPYSFTLNGLEHLKELDLGTDVSGYRNFNLTTLPFTSKTQLPLLEKLNIRNCNNLAGGIDLSTADNLLEVKADGTLISSIDLPRYTHIESLDLPYTVQNLNLYSAHFLKHLKIYNASGVESYANLYTLNVYDSDYSADWTAEKDYEINDTVLIDNNFYRCIVQHTSVSTAVRDNQTEWATYLSTNWERTNQNISIPVDWMSIASAMIKKKALTTDLSLEKLHSAFIKHIQTLTDFDELRDKILNDGEGQIELGGTIHVLGDWSNVEVQQYGKPNGIWPNLEFNTNPAKEKVKCEVRYYHSGYLGHETPEYITNRFIDVETGIIPDIYQGMSGDDLPSRDPTAAEIFSFGSYNEDGYIPYSGWTTGTDSSAQSLMDLGYSVNSPYSPAAGQTLINLYTYYYAEAHKYTVQWKVGDRVVKEITNQDYGGGYTLKAPTIAEMRSAGITTTKVTPNANGTYTYSILTGWEKLPTNIAPINDTEKNNSICVINAVWSDEVTATLDEIFADTTELTPEQLLVFSRISASTSSISSIAQQRRFNYQMGYSGMKEGTTLIDKNNVKRISSSTLPVNINSTVLPFSKNDGFTLAIDYQFGAQGNSTLPEVLVGCYDRTGDSVTGFALYRGFNENNGGTGTFVCYGQAPYSYDSTKHKAVGDAEHRNIIVLRHEKNSSILHIYSSKAANTSSNLNTTIDEGSNTIIDISTQNLSDNAQICIGNLRADLTTNSNFSDELNNTRGSQGSIYWMKYWNEDLGAGECLQLASWPHEDMTAIITAITSAATDSTMTRPKLYFTNLNCSSHITLTNSTLVEGNANEQETKSGGWADSNTKIICDNRIWQGLPPILQAIIGKPTIGYYNHDFRIVGSESTHSLSTLKFANNSYVYAPSVSSLDNSYAGTDTNNYGFESIYELTGKTDSTTSVITPYAWLKAGTSMISAKEYQGSSAEVKWRDISSPKAYWYNIRFNEKPVTWSNSNKLTIYKVDSSMMNNQTFYDIINQGTGIKTGDIIIYTTTNSSGTSIEGVYMYISSSEAAQKGIQTLPQTNVWKTGPANSVDGGWIKSTPYVTRSVTTGTGRYPNFIYIDQEGAINSPSNSNDQAGTGELNIDFAFTI